MKKYENMVAVWNGREAAEPISPIMVDGKGNVINATTGGKLPLDRYCPECDCLFEGLSHCPICSVGSINPGYRPCFERLLDRNLDPRFAGVADLTWFPWVGKTYRETRILVVAESHYTNKTTDAEIAESIAAYRADKWSTREIMAEYPTFGRDAGWKNNGGRTNNPTFDNLTSLLCGSALLGEGDIPRRESLWKHLAFMNFIQEPMRYTPGKAPERPNLTQHVAGWNALLGVLRILEPRLVLFAGLEAAKWFDWDMKRLGVESTGLHRQKPKINRAWPRRASIRLVGETIDLEFMRHPCRYFTVGKWRDFVFANHSELRAALERIVAGSIDPIRS